MELIQLKNVYKKYDDNVIFKNLNFTINRGDSIAFTGNNGGGKSTLLKMICKLESINKGKIICYKKLRFNYVPERFPKLNVTPRQYLHMIGGIEGIDKTELDKIFDKYIQLFRIESMIDTPIKYLSKGSIQKVNIIQALLKPCDVLLFDEPLSGQDFYSQMNNTNDVLVFEAANTEETTDFEKSLDFLKLIESKSIKLTNENNIVTIYCNQSSSDEITITIIQNGYHIRRMNNEQI